MTQHLGPPAERKQTLRVCGNDACDRQVQPNVAGTVLFIIQIISDHFLVICKSSQ
jgi:hypothetical protein